MRSKTLYTVIVADDEDELREGCDLEALFMDVCRRGAASGRGRAA